jgi:hypothetical protein
MVPYLWNSRAKLCVIIAKLRFATPRHPANTLESLPKQGYSSLSGGLQMHRPIWSGTLQSARTRSFTTENVSRETF